jgi:hypothetical protein
MLTPSREVRVTAISLARGQAVASFNGGPEVIVPLTLGFDVDGDDVEFDDPSLFAVIGGCDELGWFWEEVSDFCRRITTH